MRRMFLFIVLCSAASLVLAATPAGSRGQILINEFMPDPARDWDGDGVYDYRSDEWVEVINAGPAPVDVSGYLLRDGASEDSWRYGFAGILGPGEVMVVYGSDAVAWEESNGRPAYGLSLNNAGDGLTLCLVDGTDTLAVDSFVYGGGTAADDRSIGRTLEDTGVWSVFDAWNPCGESCEPAGNGCIPTPGTSNTCMTALRRGSWGSIKTICSE